MITGDEGIDHGLSPETARPQAHDGFCGSDGWFGTAHHHVPLRPRVGEPAESPKVQIGANVRIGCGVVVGSDVNIDAGAAVRPNTVRARCTVGEGQVLAPAPQ